MTQFPSLWSKDKAHFTHPWTHFDSFKKEGSLIMNKGEGCYVFDLEGKKYLDCIGGLWCVNIGYGRAEMADAIASQAKQLAFFNPFVDTSNVPATELSYKLSQLAPPNLNHVIFAGGGSTAIDSAYRLIQFYQHCRGKPEKRHVISRREAYHGSTYLAMSLSGKAGDRVPQFDYMTDNIHHLSCPNPYRRPLDTSVEDFKRLLVTEFERKILELGPENVAAFFAEPIMGAGGVIVPPDGYLEEIDGLCKRYDVLFVADEVVTAFGRLGHMFASKDFFGLRPDIITCAKGLTSGYQPLGATIYSDQIHDAISAPDPDKVFAHGFTYSGHPVTCAAALKNIEIIEREDICGNARRIGSYFATRMKELEDLPIVGEVRGSHFMLCIENVKDKITKELFPSELNIGKRISDHAEDLGLIVRPIEHLNIVSPPLIMTREQVDFAVTALGDAIARTTDDLVRQGHLN